MKEKILVVSSNLNTHTYKENRHLVNTPEWLEERIGIYVNYTLKSLRKQTSQDFIHILKCSDTSMELVKSIFSKHEKLPPNVFLVKAGDYDSFLQSKIKDYKQFYWVRLDSDDMFHMEYMEKLNNYKPKEETEVLITDTGYRYCSIRKVCIETFYKSPPFYALIYNTKEYIEGKRYRLRNGHGGAILLNHEIIGGKNFLWHNHTLNTINFFDKLKVDDEDIITDKDEVDRIVRGFI